MLPSHPTVPQYTDRHSLSLRVSVSCCALNDVPTSDIGIELRKAGASALTKRPPNTLFMDVIVIEPGDVEKNAWETPIAEGMPIAEAVPEIDRGGVASPVNKNEEESSSIPCFAYILFAPAFLLSMPIYIIERCCCNRGFEPEG